MTFSCRKLGREFYAWQRGEVLANPAHEMRTNTRMNLFISKLPFHGVVFCAIVAMLASTAIAGPEKWASKDKNVEVAQEEPFNWTGLYVGGHIGAVWNDYDFGSFDSAANVFQQDFGFARDPIGDQDIVFFHTPGIDGGSDDSIMGGGQAGYNFQFGHFVFGVEADFSGVATERTTTFTSDEETDFFFDSLSTSTNFTSLRTAETDWMASARARFGYAGGPGRRVLLYVTGGVALADVKVLLNDRAVTSFFVPAPVVAAPGVPPGLFWLTPSPVLTWLTMTALRLAGLPAAVRSGPLTIPGVWGWSTATTILAITPTTSERLGVRSSPAARTSN